MHFIDRMFLMWHSKAAIAAAMPAGMVQFAMLCMPLGIAMYVNTFVAQYQGAGRKKRIGAIVWQGVWLGVFATPLFMLLIPLAPILFTNVGHDPEVAQLETSYFQILTIGAPGAVLAAALAAFFIGRGETKLVMYGNFLQAGLNVFLDYLWIFGHAGFPEMGMEGAAWATAASIWAKFFYYVAIIRSPSYWAPFGFVGTWKLDLALFGRLLKFGGPAGLQMLLENSAFTVFIMFVGLLGTNIMAATTLAFNVNSVAFIPMIGLSIAVTTIVGQYQGSRQPILSARATWSGFAIAAAYMGTFALLYVLSSQRVFVRLLSRLRSGSV